VREIRDRWALVTGASSGLGADFARELAAHGAHLVLVARREERLKQLAAELEGRHGVRTRVVAMDLGRPGAPKALHERMQAEAVPVDVLVNNAGFAVPGLFPRSDLARTLSMIRVNVDAPVALARLLLPGMLARDRGGILTVASVAGFSASPVQSAYGGTKAFLRVWSHSLHAELKHTNLAITALCPGVTDTEFFEAAGFSKMSGFLRWRADAAKVARKGVAAFAKGKMQLVPGGANKLLMFARRFTSERFAALTARRLMMGRTKALRSRSPHDKQAHDETAPGTGPA
jgi:short-subunit dehydrogenase